MATIPPPPPVRVPGISRAQIVPTMARSAAITDVAAGRALDAFIALVRGGLKQGKHITIEGFGSWELVQFRARSARNPRTGAAVKVQAKKMPVFRAAPALVAALN